MYDELKKRVCDANLELPRRGLVTFTWGNASEIDREKGVIVIKPSGVDYEGMNPSQMVVLDLDGNVIDGELSPSSDAPTHVYLYKAFKGLGGIVHTHSTYATSWAQACRDIPAYGTTHADYYYGCVPCARALTADEINGEYEKNTGAVIEETFIKRGIDPLAVPAVIVSSHGPFTWGKNAMDAVHSAAVLEEVAKMALFSEQINARMVPAPQVLQDKHYYRKHGANAYYGQKKK